MKTQKNLTEANDVETPETEHGSVCNDLLSGNFATVVVADGEPAWSHGMESGQRIGISNRTYRENGMAEQIVYALALALEQAAFEAGLSIDDCGMDIPESHCDSCDMRFNLCWNRNPVYDKPEYCPFCGEEIEEVINETNDDD